MTSFKLVFVVIELVLQRLAAAKAAAVAVGGWGLQFDGGVTKSIQRWTFYTLELVLMVGKYSSVGLKTHHGTLPSNLIA